MEQRAEHLSLTEAEVDYDGSTTRSSLSELAAQNPQINRIEVLNDRLIPGSDCGLEHVVVANHAIYVIRSSPRKGRVRISKDTIHINGVNLQIMLAGLKARVESTRHMSGGELPVFGAIFLTRQPKAPVKHFGSIPIGSPSAIVQSITEQHCKADVNPNLRAIVHELDGIFLRSETFELADAA